MAIKAARVVPMLLVDFLDTFALGIDLSFLYLLIPG
jgi:hypothetical protein